MAIFTKFQPFVQALAEGKHNLSTCTFYAQLLNSLPSVTSAIESDLPADLTSGNGYTQGGVSLGTATASGQTGGLYTLKIADKVITASGGTIGAFQYVVLFNNSATNKDLIGYYDYGSSITLKDTESFTINNDETNGVLTLQ
jgi:hypothetical protein